MQTSGHRSLKVSSGRLSCTDRRTELDDAVLVKTGERHSAVRCKSALAHILQRSEALESRGGVGGGQLSCDGVDVHHDIVRDVVEREDGDKAALAPGGLLPWSGGQGKGGIGD